MNSNKIKEFEKFCDLRKAGFSKAQIIADLKLTLSKYAKLLDKADEQGIVPEKPRNSDIVFRSDLFKKMKQECEKAFGPDKGNKLQALQVRTLTRENFEDFIARNGKSDSQDKFILISIYTPPADGSRPSAGH